MGAALRNGAISSARSKWLAAQVSFCIRRRSTRRQTCIFLNQIAAFLGRRGPRRHCHQTSPLPYRAKIPDRGRTDQSRRKRRTRHGPRGAQSPLRRSPQSGRCRRTQARWSINWLDRKNPKTHAKICLNVRGICCFMPGDPKYSKNIEVIAVIDCVFSNAPAFSISIREETPKSIFSRWTG